MNPVSAEVSFPQLEEKILSYWKKNNIFLRSMDPLAPTSLSGEKLAQPRPAYIFYDGPPFATGLPHYGHLLAGTIKDVVGRYFTMKGMHVDRRFGWDCHGVPVEFEVQKNLSVHGAKGIREFGIGKFNEECRNIVLRYANEWEKFVERSGRWVDFERQYRTMDLDFMESIWAVFKRLWDRGLIYEGVKCTPYSWAINTPLSNFEANLNYQNVQDPAVTVRVTLLDEAKKKLQIEQHTDLPLNLYIWTTTPWTLPSNMAIAVGKDITYAVVLNAAQKELVVVAKDLAPQLFPALKEETQDESVKIVAEFSGAKLLGLEYKPMFPYFAAEREKKAFRIYPGDFVTAEDGTGLVHLASFGEDDLKVFLEQGITIVDPVDEEGNFTNQVPEFAGMNIKAADPKIIAALKQNGALVSHKTIEHSYPFCYRTDTPLIYKSISTWFVKVELIREELMQANAIIHWVPEHLREGRMGKWLENARDWAISRNRFWGNPLPIWRCAETGEAVCIGSVAELEERTGAKVTDLHCHFINDLTFPTADGKGVMRRVPEVLDCWFESGSMPYAQQHYPFESKEQFEANFPADFIAEGLDQTRGWFYTLLVLSTALFGRPAFKNVIVNGIVLAEDGKKMSKSLKNYPPPDEVMNELGADAMRLYMLASAATRAEEIRFSKAGVQEVVRQTLLPLWNAYNFFVTYALVDKWTPEDVPSEPSPNLLDKWILSKVASLIERADKALNHYHLYAVAPALLDFVDQLTNWYIRLNRRRFWASNDAKAQEDKRHAYATLHQVLLSFVRVLAPLAPFISEEIFLNLSKGVKGIKADSVHMTPFPSLQEFSGLQIDERLEHAMECFEEIIFLGRNIRNDAGVKGRQPLRSLTIVHPNKNALKDIRLLDDYIREELNVKQIEYSAEEEQFVELSAQLNTKKLGKVLGPKLGSDGMKKLRKEAEELTNDHVRSLEVGKTLKLAGEELSIDDFVVKRSAKTGIKGAASSGQITIVLDTAVTRELQMEGLAREFVNRVQKIRKDFDFDITDRIIVRYMTGDSQISFALHEHQAYVMRETLTVDIDEVRSEEDMSDAMGVGKVVPQEIESKNIIIGIRRVEA